MCNRTLLRRHITPIPDLPVILRIIRHKEIAVNRAVSAGEGLYAAIRYAQA